MEKELEMINSKIYTIRGLKVMLDRDLADLYQVETRRLNEQVKRNISRFPADFMFQLTKDEVSRSQFAILKQGQNIKYLPYAFTEQGVAMLSSVLNSEIAIEINIKIMRAFIELRQIIAAQPEYELLREKILRIEAQVYSLAADNRVDKRVVMDKVTQLSRKVNGLDDKVDQLSEILDQFQDAHIVIRRPDLGLIGE